MEFCVREEARVIVIPSYDKEFSKIVQYRSGMYSPLYLGSRIREFLKYKAWSAGIVVLELSAEGTSSRCLSAEGRSGRTELCLNVKMDIREAVS